MHAEHEGFVVTAFRAGGVGQCELGGAYASADVDLANLAAPAHFKQHRVAWVG